MRPVTGWVSAADKICNISTRDLVSIFIADITPDVTTLKPHPVDSLRLYSSAIQAAAIDAILRPSVYKRETLISNDFNLINLLGSIKPTDIMSSPESLSYDGIGVFPVEKYQELSSAEQFVEENKNIKRLSLGEAYKILAKLALRRWRSLNPDKRLMDSSVLRELDSTVVNWSRDIAECTRIIGNLLNKSQEDAKKDTQIFLSMIESMNKKIYNIQPKLSDDYRTRNQLKNIYRKAQQENICAKVNVLIDQHVISRDRLTKQFNKLLILLNMIDSFSRATTDQLSDIRNLPIENSVSIGAYWTFCNAVSPDEGSAAFQQTIDILNSMKAIRDRASLAKDAIRQPWNEVLTALERIPVATRTQNQKELYEEMTQIPVNKFEEMVTRWNGIFAIFVESTSNFQSATLAESERANDIKRLMHMLRSIHRYRERQGYELFKQWPKLAKAAITEIDRNGKICDKSREEIARLLLYCVSMEFPFTPEMNMWSELVVYAFSNIDGIMLPEPSVVEEVLAAAEHLWQKDKLTRFRGPSLEKKFQCTERICAE